MESLDIVQERTGLRLLNQPGVKEHRHLMDDKSAPKRRIIQTCRVGQESAGANVPKACGMEMPSQVGRDEILIDRFLEDCVEGGKRRQVRRAHREKWKPLDCANPPA